MNTVSKLTFMEEAWYKKAKRLFRDRKITHDKIGKRLGVEKASISQKLNGKNSSTSDEMIIIAGMLDMSLDELCGDDPNYTTDKKSLNIINKLRTLSEDEQDMFLKMLESLSE